LGENYGEAVTVTRIVMVAAVAYTIYVSMRSIIDAYYLKAINTLNIIVALLIFLIFSFLSQFFAGNYIHLLFIFVIGVFSLGALTLHDIVKINDSNFSEAVIR
jgi:hypothetical protein